MGAIHECGGVGVGKALSVGAKGKQRDNKTATVLLDMGIGDT